MRYRRVFLPAEAKGWTESEKYSKIYIKNVIGKYSWRERPSSEKQEAEVVRLQQTFNKMKKQN